MSTDAKSKIVIISSSRESWVSCEGIAADLSESYSRAFGQRAVWLEYQPSQTSWEIFALAGRIKAERPLRLVFISSKPHPRRLLQALKAVYGSRPLPELYFHLYGDFVLSANDWCELADVLRSQKCVFIAASERHRQLVQRLLHRQEAELCPFSIDEKTFRVRASRRSKTRTQLNVKEDERLILYAGRFSLQKNIDWLISEFSDFLKRSKKPARLFLAGSFDDLGATAYGVQFPLGHSYTRIRHLLSTLEPAIRNQITFLPKLATASLVDLYNAADLCVSLSLYHEEDFGRAPAEALACGCELMLTDWAGFDALAESSPSNVRLIPVQMTDLFPSIETGSLASSLSVWSGRYKYNEANRHKRSRELLSTCSTGSVAKTLRQLHDRNPSSTFNGFTITYEEQKKNWRRSFVEPSLRAKVYGPYLRGSL